MNLGMWTASRLTGQVTDPDGKPVIGFPVEIQAVEEDRNFHTSVKTDAKGNYEFEKIPAGDYVIGVNPDGISSELPFEPVFFPSVAKRSAAQVVKITGAQTIEQLDLHIGPRKITRDIVIAVEWPDQRPVINASVACKTQRRSDNEQIDAVHRYVDANGTATCTVLADREYIVEADRLSWEHSSRPIQPIANRAKENVTAGAFPIRLKLVIDPSNDISATEKPTNMAKYNDREF
jgi:hypothetical protein